MSILDIFWSFPLGIKQSIFDNLLEEEKKFLCNNTQEIRSLCQKYIDFSTLGYDVEKGDIKRVDFLLKQGADINGSYMLAYVLMTPLTIAVQENNIPMIKFLLEKGADVQKETAYYFKPWFFVKSKEAAELLLNYGVDINETDTYGKNLLFRAVENKNLDLIEFLVEKGIDINHTDKRRQTAIINFVSSPLYLDVVKLLLKLGLNPNIKDKDGDTALDAALLSTNDRIGETIKTLYQYGAKRGEDL